MSDDPQPKSHGTLVRHLGPVLGDALRDPAVIEVMVNPNGDVFIEKLGQGVTKHPERMRPEDTAALLKTIAALLQTVISRDHPTLQGELPGDGSRVSGSIPPISEGPTLTIRKRASSVFTLADYVSAGRMTEAQANQIIRAVSDRKNIVITGGTGTGKTTLANALLAEIARVHPADRLVVIEDTRELQVSSENRLMLRSTEQITMNDLLRHTMRQRPDRIIIGECRGGEALALLKSWNTGHPGGVATVHANSARHALTRLEQLIAEAIERPMPGLIGEAVDLVIHLAKMDIGPVVTEIVEVEEFDPERQRYLTH